MKARTIVSMFLRLLDRIDSEGAGHEVVREESLLIRGESERELCKRDRRGLRAKAAAAG